MLLEKKSPHFLTSVLVRLVAHAFLLIGAALFVVSMVQLALGDGLIEGVFYALILLLSGFLLLRLRSNGLWLFALLVLYAYGQMIVLQDADFWPQFFFNLILLMVLCLIFPSYFALRRGEGRRTARLIYFFVALLYIALTSLSLAAYYDDAFCAYKHTAPTQSDHIGQSLHVALHPFFSQWLPVLPCYADGALLHEPMALLQSSAR